MKSLLGLTPAFLLSACATLGAASMPARIDNGMWVNGDGLTLYTFDRDLAGSGRSVCNGPCATNWPPLTASADAAPSGDWTVVTRDDSSRQWAYKGKPLYAWLKDQKPGDTTGNGVNNAWRIARP